MSGGKEVPNCWKASWRPSCTEVKKRLEDVERYLQYIEEAVA
jgi:hypothetical protein